MTPALHSPSSPRGLRIGTRLALGFGLLIAMMLSMVVVGLLRLGTVADANTHIIEVDWTKAKAANTLSSIAQANARRTIEIVTAPTPEHRAKMRADIVGAREQFLGAFKTLQELVQIPEAKTMLKEAEEARGRYVASQAKFNELVDAGRLDEATVELNTHTLRELGIVQARVDALADLEQRLVVEGGAKARAQADSARLLLLVLGLIGLACGVALAVWITRSITAPLSEAVRVAQAVASGDLSTRVEVRSSDETGQLLQALKDMNESLSGIVQEVRGGSDAIATATSQIAAGNLDLSSRTEEQAAALEQTAASMQELAGTVKQNFDSGKHANELAESASQVAVKGGAVVSQVVHTMEAINVSSRKIADIIGVIDGIAFQTNILALNAAVEAARAGEQGRGFAVVASEVRSLAGRSAVAAKEIKELIEASVNNVSEGCTLVEKAGSTMDEIVVSVRRVADIMGE
ncbi:MAG: methyl-accepting chemotaxis protein, partial [Giesbergeria sp.]|nr:methyl-accepting chemotaxis protein [Giesbergeria sp.]